ncbi:hypothetical protein PAXINDRAFT_156328 [Paxillus involutus ATCC 200175]|uniref:DUF6532 domain-containing protein n=1 Tax=Paxillus involutus ATCC 200175 TaxID=664439 RepID=A0A0C9U314_PAXIN|nr:hypothetical protein PAXINDRAFT_156328 [Paxillus involutus ATCC 200175]
MDDLDDLETPILALIQSPAQQSTSATNIDPPSVACPVVAVASSTSGTIPDNNDPSQLQFYAPSIRDIIERAKQFSHCDITSANSFPLCPDFNNKAVEYMNEAIAECHSRGWWPQYMPDITRLLWEDIGSWWSSLKKKAHSHVRECYEWDPQNCCTINADIAKKLLDRGSFLKHGMNEEIKLALDEMAAKGKEVTFKQDVYAGVYVNIISLMTKCDTAPVHRAKTKALCVQWVKIRRNGNLSESFVLFWLKELSVLGHPGALCNSLSKGLSMLSTKGYMGTAPDFDSIGMTWDVLDRACQLHQENLNLFDFT